MQWRIERPRGNPRVIKGRTQPRAADAAPRVEGFGDRYDRRKDQACSWIQASSWLFGAPPIFWAATWPFLNMIRVGMALML